MTWDGGDDPAPEGQRFVCSACGRSAETRYGLRDTSCITHAVLCWDDFGPWRAGERWRKWRAVDGAD